jgi:REP element-mobilizing transposase RayT
MSPVLDESGLKASFTFGFLFQYRTVSEMPKPRRSGPPHNPGVRELVSGKRKSSPPKREDARLGFRGWHERGYLPHRDEPRLTQFVTFHLADSFPAALRSEWEALLKIEADRDRRQQLEAYLDRGRGECHLRRADIAKLAEDAFRFHHGQWYDLLAWVVMPNHVHLLVKVGNASLSKIVKELKRYTAREANKILRQDGAFWAEDYFDTYMRDTGHELKTRRYIENNPVKARLVREPKEWPWSSARFCDKLGVLHL